MRTQSLTAVIAEITAIGKRGSWKVNKEWEVIINSFTSPEIGQVLDAVAKLTPSDARETLRATLYSRWGECDPATAMRGLPLGPDPVIRSTCLQAIVQGWAHANAAEVLVWAEQLPPGDLKLTAYIAATSYETANGTGKPPAASAAIALPAATPDPRAAVTAAAKIPDRDQRLKAYREIAKEWAAADPATASTWAAGLAIAAEREALIELTTTAWWRANPMDAVSFMVARAEVPRHLTEHAFLSWARRDFPTASRWARQLSDPKQRSLVFLAAEAVWLDRAPDEVPALLADFAPDSYEYLLAGTTAASRWAEADPARLFTFLRSLRPDSARRFLTPEMLQSIARSRPQPLLEFLRDIPPGQRADLFANALVSIAAQNTQEARQALALLQGQDDEVAVRRLLIQRMPETLFDLAVELYGELPPGQPQTEALQFLADRLSRKEPQKALAWVKAQPSSPATQNALYRIIRQLGHADPQAALRELQTLPVSPQRNGMAAEVVANWATQSQAPALAFLRSLPESEEREGVLLAVAQRIGYADAPKGLGLLTEGDAGPNRLSAIQQIAQNWAQNDAPAARRWAERQPQVAIRETVLLSILYSIAQSSPAEAAKIAGNLTQPAAQRQGIAAVTQVWTAFDPKAASRWATSLSPAGGRAEAIAAVAGHWVQRDAVAASAWLAELPSEDVPDEAWRNVAQNTVTRKPADAVRYALRIRNADARNELVVRFVSYWLEQNRAEAEQWLATAELGPEVREKIRKGIETRRF